MISFPNCKINLGLQILRRRTDGYHDLQTVFYPLPLKDILEVIRLPAAGPAASTQPPAPTSPAAPPTPAEPAFTAYGLPIPGDPWTNLCLKAWRLLQTDFPALPPVHIHLYKQIPIGAGLGGGSANGAWTLRALDSTFHLGLSHEQLLHYAAQLGSDCPFFLLNTPCIGGGRGEQLEPIALDLTGYSFALVDPGIHISTAHAFSLCTPNENIPPIRDIVSRPIHSWRNLLVNDFEEPIFRLHPELETIKETLYAQGAIYASLTGSGSGFFGIFEKGHAPSEKNNYRILP